MNRLGNCKNRFAKAKEIIQVKPPERSPTDSYVLAFSVALLLLARAKHLFQATLIEDKNKNAYACYVLVRAFFETAMALGYLTITVDKKTKSKDLEGIWKVAHRMHMGGKYFPTDESLKQMGEERVEPVNVYDFIDTVDEDMKNISGKKNSFSPHREMYDVVLSEYGHPNYLGLSIASSLNNERQMTVDLAKGAGKEFRKDYLNYLSWGSLIFFHYWDKLAVQFKTFDLELPSL